MNARCKYGRVEERYDRRMEITATMEWPFSVSVLYRGVLMVTVYCSPMCGRVSLILRTPAGTIFCVSFFMHGRSTSNRKLPIIVGIRRKGQGHTKEFCQCDFLFGIYRLLCADDSGRSGAGVSSGTRDATTVVWRRKIASCGPIAWSSCPVCVNKMSDVLYLRKF